MLEWIIIGAVTIFGFKKGTGILAEGFAKGILIALGGLVALLLLGGLLIMVRGCTGAW